MKTAQIVLPDGFSFQTEVPETPQERADGLRNRPNAGNGMLFVFSPETPQPTMTMQGVKFPLDMVWIDQYGSVIASWSFPVSNFSGASGNGRFVLELPAGSIKAHGITRGSKISIS
jgi:uncharacterized membrane protein (UPF0127 family)